MSKASKCPRLHPWEKKLTKDSSPIHPDEVSVRHWGGGGAFETEAGQELPLLLSLIIPQTYLPYGACKCLSCRADMLYKTQDDFQHRSLALACFSSQPLTWHHHVETPQNFLSSRPSQRNHSAREELQHQCFTSSFIVNVIIYPRKLCNWLP